MGEPRDVIRRNNFEKPKKKRYNEYNPTDSDGKIVYSYAAYGATNEDIAAALGLDNKTVTKYYPEELLSGRATAKNKIAQRLYQMAVGRDPIYDPETKELIDEGVRPNLGALIFLAKTRLGWKETHVVEQNVDFKPQGVSIYLPDNGMRCIEGKNAK